MTASKTLQSLIHSLETQQEMGLLPDFLIVEKKKVRSQAEKKTPKPAQPAQNIPVSASSSSLEEVRAKIGDCTRCRLHQGRTHIVFGVGNPQADLMFVGEAPGRDEDLKAEPFVGRAGQLLTKIIQAMGFERSDIYIANVVKCLRYNALVQLEDGSWERIGRLVKNRYAGKVRSVDTTGNVVSRRVTGWHATPLGNRVVYKLTYRSAKLVGTSKCGIHVTGDHPVLTERGYVPVSELNMNDRIAVGHGFSQVVFSLIYGSLLGDGHISNQKAHFSFSHSIKQNDYALFKAKLLENELGCVIQNVAVAAGGEEKYPIVKCYTRAHRSLKIVRHDFYKTKKIVPHYLPKIFNAMMLAFWFMDDGYTRIRVGKQPLAEIATCAFSSEDINVLIECLKTLDLCGYERAGRIYFNVEETKKLSRVIAPYIPHCMRYKLHPEIALSIPFDSNLFQSSPPQTLFDWVEKIPVILKGTDKTFYCIDVEETHNFVTSGGVVHNCRPPENRNPAPDEIETCSPFLFEQIQLIQPKVIVCLGNFAVQTLLATEEKITNLRGRFHLWPNAIAQSRLNIQLPLESIKLMPTYHPAFLLRNPNMKKPVWEDMQLVMKELKA